METGPEGRNGWARFVTGLTIFRYLAKYKIMNAVFKALADPTRRKILELLRQREMTAGEIADHFPLSKSTMSGHFAVLREAELVDTEKNGTVITYRLRISVLEEALLSFAGLLGIGLPREEGSFGKKENPS